MKTKYLIIVLLLFAIKTLQAQDPNNHWQLGNTDINFSTDPPIVQSVVNGKYGIASISDSNGNLLFYANETAIFNKNHQNMYNNSASSVSFSFSTFVKQPVVIVPYPGNDKKYYVFFSRVDQFLNGYSNSFSVNYSCQLVDFSNPLFPLGTQTGINFPVYSTSGVYNQTNGALGPLTVVKNSTNDGYFVIFHLIANSQNTSKYIAFKITSQGLNLTPVESIIQSNLNYEFSTSVFPYTTTTSAIKFTPNNNKMGELIMTSGRSVSGQYFYRYSFFTLDFNNVAGTFSNLTLFDQQPNVFFSGQESNPMQDFEFSNDSEKVFFSGLYVKSMNNPSLPRRYLTQTGQPNPTGFLRLQRDKNSNIIVSSGNNFLHKIDNQDSYQNATVGLNYLQTNNSIHYLPQLIQSLAIPCPNNLTVSSNVVSGIDNKQAQNTITATNTISNGASAIYHAGVSVVLSPSFNAIAGSKFRAYIEGCSGVFLPEPEFSVNNEETTFETEEVNEVKEVIKVYPNPNNGDFKINIESIQEGNLQITDLFGLTVYSLDFKSQNEFEINIQDRPTGFYIIKLITNDKVVTKKIFKN